MEETWLSDLADELAECLLEARACAAACEELLETARSRVDEATERQLAGVLVAPAAICQVLIDLLDRPRGLLLAAAQVCRETTQQGADALEALDVPLETADAVAKLRAAAASSDRLLRAASG